MHQYPAAPSLSNQSLARQSNPADRIPEQYTGGIVKGESRVEYYPIERTYTEYEQVRTLVQVPVVRQVTEYYTIEHKIEYIPQVIQERVIDYMPVEKYASRIEYQKIEKQLMANPQTQGGDRRTQEPLSTRPLYNPYSRPNLDEADDRVPLGIRSRTKII